MLDFSLLWFDEKSELPVSSSTWPHCWHAGSGLQMLKTASGGSGLNHGVAILYAWR